MFSRRMDETYQDSGCTTLFVRNLIDIYFQGVAVLESVHLRLFKSCLPCCIHVKKGFHHQRNGCMDLVMCSFRGENGKLDVYSGDINSFAVCNNHLTLSLHGTI